MELEIINQISSIIFKIVHSQIITDEFSITIDNPEHSDEEERLLILGLSHKKRLLVVIYTGRGNKIRLISARKANRKERKKYEEDF